MRRDNNSQRRINFAFRHLELPQRHLILPPPLAEAAETHSRTQLASRDRKHVPTDGRRAAFARSLARTTKQSGR